MDKTFEKDDPTLADAWRSRRRKYWEDLMWLFELGKTVSESGAHSKTQREWLDGELATVLGRYDTTDDADLEKHVRMMERHLHGMFAFVEYPGVEPTNNASERALRYYVVFRKIIGQTRGGPTAMRRLGDLSAARGGMRVRASWRRSPSWFRQVNRYLFYFTWTFIVHKSVKNRGGGRGLPRHPSLGL